MPAGQNRRRETSSCSAPLLILSTPGLFLRSTAATGPPSQVVPAAEVQGMTASSVPPSNQYPETSSVGLTSIPTLTAGKVPIPSTMTMTTMIHTSDVTLTEIEPRGRTDTIGLAGAA